MRIFIDEENTWYTQKAKDLRNAVTVENDGNYYYYEFTVLNREATIKYSDLLFIEEATSFYKSTNYAILRFKTLDDSFYKEYDYLYSFKLPVQVLQPSSFFLNEERLMKLEGIDDDNIYIHVAIIDDEYVILDGHHRLKHLIDNDYRLVNVVIVEPLPSVYDMVYIAKEQNIRNVKMMEVLTKEEYLEYLKSIENIF